jgi:hypothetical protein
MAKERPNRDTASLDDLYELLRIDLDALRAFESTLSRLTTPELAAKIRLFLEEHERHIHELQRLSAKIKTRPTGTPPFEIPEQIRAMISSHRDNERRHLEFIQSALRDAEASLTRWENEGESSAGGGVPGHRLPPH